MQSDSETDYQAFLCIHRRNPSASHGWADIPLLLMVIRFAAHCAFLLHELSEPLAVDQQSRWRRWWRGVPNDLSHVAKQSGGTEQGRWITVLLHAIQKKLCILMALFRCGSQPMDGLWPIFIDLAAQKIQLAQDVLSLRVLLFNGIGEMF